MPARNEGVRRPQRLPSRRGRDVLPELLVAKRQVEVSFSSEESYRVGSVGVIQAVDSRVSLVFCSACETDVFDCFTGECIVERRECDGQNYCDSFLNPLRRSHCGKLSVLQSAAGGADSVVLLSVLYAPSV